MAEIDAKVGGYGIVPSELDGAIVSSHYYLYDINQDKLSLSYLKYYLKTDDFFNQIKPQGSTNYAAIRPKDILDISIPLPHLEVQGNITNKLKVVYDNIELCNAKIESNFQNIFALRQSILQEAIQGKLVSQDTYDEPASILLQRVKDEKEQLIKEKKIKKPKTLSPIELVPFKLRKNWAWVKMGEVSFITKLAGFEYTKFFDLKDNAEVPVIRAQNVKMNKIDTNNLKYIDRKVSDTLHRSALYKKCLIMTFIGAGIGDVAIFDKGKRFHLAPNVAKIELFNNFNINIEEKYILYYLMSALGRTEIFKFSKATAQPSLSMETIREIIVPLPPLNEQKRIVERVDQLMVLCDELEKAVEQSKSDIDMLMQSVLKVAFSQSEKDDNVVDFPSTISNEIEDWEIAARSTGEINSDTKVKIKNRVIELLGKSQQ